MATRDRIEIDNPASYRGTPFKYLISYTIRFPEHAPVFKETFWKTVRLKHGVVVLSRSAAIRGPEDINGIERELERHLKKQGRLVRGRLRGNITVTGFSRFED